MTESLMWQLSVKDYTKAEATLRKIARINNREDQLEGFDFQVRYRTNDSLE